MSYMLEYPSHLQVDTFDYCNLNCRYCCFHNPSPEPSEMPLHTIEKIASQLTGWSLDSIRPFSHGDPLFNNRLPKIIEIFRKYSKAPIVLFTNGTYYAGKHLLVNPAVECVEFTISAATPETFLKMTGKNLFNEALRTLEWFRNHKEPNQHANVRFILTNVNEHEVDVWKTLFKDYQQFISPLHRHLRNTKLVDPIVASEKNQGRANAFKGIPCGLWNNMGINVHGDIIQCCGGDDVTTYGNITNTPLLEGWRKRCLNNLQNPVCQSCSLRMV